MEYFAFGETFLEEHSNTERTPYLYNGKELDEETGLYYYGARYYDARTSVWQSVDPLAEKFPGWSPYNYTMQNPIILVDPDGREVDISQLNNKNHQVALQNMMCTEEGRAFIGRYMAEGQTLIVGDKSYTFDSTGDRAKDVLHIRSSDMGDNGLNRTFTKDNKKQLNQIGPSDKVTDGVSQVIDLKNGLSDKKATMTLGHEALVHADKDADALNKIEKNIKDGNYSSLGEYVNDVYSVSTGGKADHNALGNGKVTKYENYAKELSQQKNDAYYEKEYKRQVDQYKP